MDFQTWQIDKDGVLFLKEYGVETGDSFSTGLFMQMWEQRLVYVGDDRKEYWHQFALFDDFIKHGPVTVDDLDLNAWEVRELLSAQGQLYYDRRDRQVRETSDYWTR